MTGPIDVSQLGDVQQAELVALGVPPHRIIIGHCCGTAYHRRILDGGSYVAFDRFGINALFPDDKRVAALIAIIQDHRERQLVLSHDSVWCWRGQPPRIRATRSGVGCCSRSAGSWADRGAGSPAALVPGIDRGVRFEGSWRVILASWWRPRVP